MQPDDRRFGAETAVATPDTAFQIALLGAPDARWSGRPVHFPRRQSRALLYRIAAAPHPAPRDQLCFLFWPDTSETTARSNLTVLLNHLRRALPQPDLLVAADDTVGLRRPDAWSDTLAFTEASAAALRERRIDLLAAAVDLYRGPFPHGFTLPGSPEWEDWASQERQAWERQYLRALGALIEGLAARGDARAAIAAAHRYLAVDELAEDVHRRLMALYAVAGDRAAAMRQFERCAALLEHELDVDP